MKTPTSIIVGIVIGAVAMFYYMAIQNTANLAYQNAVADMAKAVCPSLIAKVEAPVAKK